MQACMQNRRMSSHWLRTNACVWIELVRESKGAHVKAVGEPPVCDSVLFWLEFLGMTAIQK